ncbi:MAG: hypothetical protein LBD88_00430 [Candidatus Peribacteria bacterium]|jgi:hypothetical protein|nr:hypothetical protein [Candidatus Peribacteria bacterium]
MRKIILILLLMSFIASCNAETSINKNLYNLLSVQESIVKTKIRDINSNILEKAINIIDRDVKNINSVDKVTMYTFLKNVFEKELQER